MTHPVEGLKPGPLAGQDLSLLKPGSSVVRSMLGTICTVERVRPDGLSMTYTWADGYGDGPTEVFSYIGEQDAEGWIAAPEGGWSENPVPGMVISVLGRHAKPTCGTVPHLSDEWPWGELHISAFRPVSTKPQGGDQGALQAQAPSVTSEQAEGAVVDHMVSRFLAWRLPENFAPDNGITFKATFNDHMNPPMRCNPTGTNLLDRTQAEAMVRHMLEGLPK